LMLKIGKEIRTSSTWFKLGLSAGASLASMLDVASDVYTINIYRGLGKHETADFMTLFVIVSFGLQILFVGEWQAEQQKQQNFQTNSISFLLGAKLSSTTRTRRGRWLS